MPASNETVSNRPLSGDELRQIICRDLDSMLRHDGMFQVHIGYGRVSYELLVKVHTGNPHYPEHEIKVVSKAPAKNETDPLKLAVEGAPPLKPKEKDGSDLDDSLIAGLSRTREIDSPNVARVEMGLAITVDRKNRETGQMTEEKIVYDNTNLPAESVVKDKDVTEKVAKEWGV